MKKITVMVENNGEVKLNTNGNISAGKMLIEVGKLVAGAAHVNIMLKSAGAGAGAVSLKKVIVSAAPTEEVTIDTTNGDIYTSTHKFTVPVSSGGQLTTIQLLERVDGVGGMGNTTPQTNNQQKQA